MHVGNPPPAIAGFEDMERARKWLFLRVSRKKCSLTNTLTLVFPRSFGL